MTTTQFIVLFLIVLFVAFSIWKTYRIVKGTSDENSDDSGEKDL